METRPGGEMATRPLHFIWIVDCSGSMGGSKIRSLNHAVKEAIPHMRKAADENPNAQVKVRALMFSSGANWQVSDPVPIETFEWQDMVAGGYTDMGRALQLVADQLKMPPMEERALPPVLILLSDGQPTDDFASGLKALLDEPWGRRAVRLAIAIGGDADKTVLQRFVDHPELPVLEANNSHDLVNFIKWASTAVVRSVSSPTNAAAKAGSVGLPPPPPPATPGTVDDGEDVW